MIEHKLCLWGVWQPGEDGKCHVRTLIVRKKKWGSLGGLRTCAGCQDGRSRVHGFGFPKGPLPGAGMVGRGRLWGEGTKGLDKSCKMPGTPACARAAHPDRWILPLELRASGGSAPSHKSMGQE